MYTDFTDPSIQTRSAAASATCPPTLWHNVSLCHWMLFPLLFLERFNSTAHSCLAHGALPCMCARRVWNPRFWKLVELNGAAAECISVRYQSKKAEREREREREREVEWYTGQFFSIHHHHHHHHHPFHLRSSRRSVLSSLSLFLSLLFSFFLLFFVFLQY